MKTKKNNPTKKKTVKVKLFYTVHDSGDGSASVDFFVDKKTADIAAEKDYEDCANLSEGSCEKEFEINPETGEVVSGAATSWEEIYGE